MNKHRYKLEKGSKKHRCPECGKKRFVRFVDIETGDYLPEQYGRCDREINCPQQEYNNPYKDGYAKAIWEQEHGNKTDWKPKPPKQIKKPVNKPKIVFISIQELKKTLTGYDDNIFIQNLLQRVPFPFEAKEVERIIELYRLGTNAKNGAVCFPFIDAKQNVRAIQEKIFDATNHTDKSKKYHTSWLHTRLQFTEYRNKPLPEWLEAYNKNDTKVSCLFGEHLLSKYPHNPVALVEAPKTAIYGTLYFGFPEQPTELLWLAVYNLSSLNLNKCKALKGRNVLLFPDLSKDGKAFELWSNRAKEMQRQLQGTCFQVSDLLEQLAPQQDKEQGKDIADYLINLDWRLFRKQDTKETPQPEPRPVETSTREKGEKSEALKKNFFSSRPFGKPLPEVEVIEPEPIITVEQEQPKDWGNDIAELEACFASIELPTQPIKLKPYSTVNNIPLFIDSHLATVKANNGNPTFLPYLERLMELKEILKAA